MNFPTTTKTPSNVATQLQQLLKYPGNLKCADCKLQLHPRWASWSLGVLICIKCAGVHRSLGTHISKVKSIDLDSWSNENLYQFIVNGDNERANSLYYENKMDSESLIELDFNNAEILTKFIKDKYQLKKWTSDTPLQPAIIEPLPHSVVANAEVNQEEISHNIDQHNNADITQDITANLSIQQTDLSNMIHLNSINSIKHNIKENNNHIGYKTYNDGFVKRSIYELYTKTSK